MNIISNMPWGNYFIACPDLVPDSTYEPFPILGRTGMRTKIKYSSNRPACIKCPFHSRSQARGLRYKKGNVLLSLRNLQSRSSNCALFPFIYFFLRFYLFTKDTQREAETQAEGKPGSMQGARCGIRSQVSRITPWAKCRCHPGVPPFFSFKKHYKSETH